MIFRTKTHLLSFVLILIFSIQASAQINKKENALWQDFTENALQKSSENRQIIPKVYRTLYLNLDEMQTILAEAPMRFSALAKSKTVVLELPLPNGEIQKFKIVNAPVLHPNLAFRFPMIRAYAGQGIDDPQAFLRFDVTQKGFHAMISSPKHSTIFIDPYAKGDTEHYIVYYKKDFEKQATFECLVENEEIKNQVIGANDATKSLLTGDCTLRKYRLALSCTGEYAQYHGGTVADVLAAMNTTMARVNGVFERDASITMEIIANNDQIIFLNAGTDPFNNNNSGVLINQNQTVTDANIGTANYDIGHVFSTGGGGLASLRSPCSSSRKAKAVTGQSNPIGDPFDIDYVAHEMGHQYGGNHTQNNNCNDVPGVSVEPGSASSIMGYAGICSPNVQNNSDDYFHIINLREMADNVVFGTSSSCPIEINTGNNAPTADAGDNYTIPHSTPFVLTGEANDLDGNGSLTYSWEQMDAQTAPMPPSSASSSGPAFRTLTPSPVSSRVFPPLDDVINNNSPTWEVLPAVGRTMNFTFTARDNNAGSGCTGDSDMTLTFAGNAGPFLVTYPNNGEVWNAGNIETVTWDVAGTNQSPVNCANVDVLLSTDGGYTYPFVLAENVPNTGSANINVPNALGSNNRVRINCSDNVFFDLSNTSFTIEEGSSPDFIFGANPTLQSVCADGEATFDLTISAFGGFNNQVTFVVNGLPTGATASFNPETLNPDGTTQMTIGNLGAADAGFYNIEVTATSLSVTKTITVSLLLTADTPGGITLSTPINGAIDQGLTTILNWEDNAETEVYQLEVATSLSFNPSTVVETGAALSTNFTLEGLLPLTIYYWHIKGSNNCGDGEYGQIFSFLTGGTTCQEYENTQVQEIPQNAVLTVISTINVPDNVSINSVSITNLDISHTWVGDLDAHLNAPSGTEINLFDQVGVPGDNFGCAGDNLLVSFHDDADLSANDFENSCGNNPAIEGDFMPISPFSNVNNENAQGDWILSVRDNAPSDGGDLNAWTLEICYELPPLLPIEIQQDTLIVETGQSGIITNEYISASSQDPSCTQTVFVITGLPANGVLFLDILPLAIGSVISESDLNGNVFDFTYIHDGSDTDSDSFTYDVWCDGSFAGWNGGNTFNIQIVEMLVYAANANIITSIDCFDNENGQIEVDVSGGAAPLQYSLDGENFQSENIFDNLPAGTYIITVQDSDGVQTITPEVILTDPEAITASASVNEYEITVDASGGTGGLLYSIDGVNFQISNVFPDLDNGSYTIIIMDENDCQTSTEAIVAVNALIASIELLNDISCTDENDANISVSIAGGMEPYGYSINGGAPQLSNIFENLGEGNYTVMVSDSDGFDVTTAEITVTNPEPFTATSSVNEFEITVNASGGTGPLLYSIDGINFQTSNVFPDLDNGSYTIIIMDENDCQTSVEAIVAVNALIASIELINDISCADENDASISVGIAGGMAPYAYSINGETPQSSNVFDNLSEGNYTVMVSDTDGFEVITTEISVTNPQPIGATSSVNEYEITVNASGGTGSLSYSIDGINFQDSNVFPDLDNGNYTIIVMDENDCQTSVEAIVAVNTLVANIELLNDISCADENDASISVGISGGMTPYLYSINGEMPQSSNIFTGLGEGNYTVVVSDGDGFEITTSEITVTNPMAINAAANVNEYEITVNANGGIGSLLYSIDGINFQASNVFPDLNNGTYDIIIMDENDCQTSIEAIVSVNPLAISASTTQEITCAEENNGIISVETFGGTAPYQYSIDGENFQDSNVFDGLPAGEYVIIVVDATDFSLMTGTVTLTAPEPISIATSIDGGSNSLTITADGGTGAYTYSIDGVNYETNNVFPFLDNGAYTIFAQDENGCIATSEIEINSILSANFSIETIDCFDDNTGSIEITVVEGGVPPYTYSLNGSDYQSSPIFNNLSEGNQVISIKGANGSIYETGITLANPNQIVITPLLQGNDLTISASGGIGSFLYSIDGGETFDSSNTFNGLDNGTYDIVVEDSNGCQETTSVTIMVNGLNAIELTLAMQVFPNPNTGQFVLNINQETEQNLAINIFDALGRSVYSTTFVKTSVDFSLQINIEHLAAGAYFLKITDGVLIGGERVLVVK